jgi:hypothetical protein
MLKWKCRMTLFCLLWNAKLGASCASSMYLKSIVGKTPPCFLTPWSTSLLGVPQKFCFSLQFVSIVFDLLLYHATYKLRQILDTHKLGLCSCWAQAPVERRGRVFIEFSAELYMGHG